MKKYEINRLREIIKKSIYKTNLDLTNKIILTEVGSSYFVFTPIIALMSNAKKVYAWVKDSAYGKSEDIVVLCNQIVSDFGLENRIEYSINLRNEEHIKEADIITNLGFVRPLNACFLQNVSNQAVIAGMCEAWELRPTDIDLNYCHKNKIKVAGTWENHPDLKIFDGCGHLAIKMAQEAGFEVYQNNIIIWSDDHFGEVIEKAFNDFGATNVIKTTSKKEFDIYLPEADFIFFCDYDEQRQIIGEHGFMDIEYIKNINSGIGIIHLYGDINSEIVKKNDLQVYPDKNGRASIMTFTLAHLGPIPIINLHTAGLRVGQCLSENIPDPLIQLV